MVFPKIIYWKYKPSGFCPVQSEGYFLGTYFYFRSRWSRAVLHFYSSDSIDDEELLCEYTLFRTRNEFAAGWLSHNFCKFLIYLGCLLFFLKIGRKNKKRICKAQKIQVETGQET